MNRADQIEKRVRARAAGVTDAQAERSLAREAAARPFRTYYAPEARAAAEATVQGMFAEAEALTDQIAETHPADAAELRRVLRGEEEGQ